MSLFSVRSLCLPCFRVLNCQKCKKITTFCFIEVSFGICVNPSNIHMSNCDDNSDDYYDDFKRGRKCFFSIHVIFNHKELQVVSTNKCISSKFPFLGHLESKLWQFHSNINSNFSKLTFICKTVPLTHELITLTAKAPLSDADVPNQSLTSYCLPLLCQITSKQEHADTMVMMKRASTRTNSVKKVRELFLNP